jgi:hypothetical protein
MCKHTIPRSICSNIIERYWVLISEITVFNTAHVTASISVKKPTNPSSTELS